MNPGPLSVALHTYTSLHIPQRSQASSELLSIQWILHTVYFVSLLTVYCSLLTYLLLSQLAVSEASI